MCKILFILAGIHLDFFIFPHEIVHIDCAVVDTVCHCFCPQALAAALKVNKTVATIDLYHDQIGNEGAKAWFLARGSVAPGLERMK